MFKITVYCGILKKGNDFGWNIIIVTWNFFLHLFNPKMLNKNIKWWYKSVLKLNFEKKKKLDFE